MFSIMGVSTAVLTPTSLTSCWNREPWLSVLHVRWLDIIKSGFVHQDFGAKLCTFIEGEAFEQWSLSPPTSYVDRRQWYLLSSLTSFFCFLTSQMHTLTAHRYSLNHRPRALTVYSPPLPINRCSSCLRNFICIQYPNFFLLWLCLPKTTPLSPGLFLEERFSSLEGSLWLGSASHETLQLIIASSGCLSRLFWHTNKGRGLGSILSNSPLLWTESVIPSNFLPTVIWCLSEGEQWVWRRW